MARSKRDGISAWLVTWEHGGNHARPEREIAAILNPRWSGERVRDHVEWIYANATFSLAERVAYAKHKSFNPYPAEFDRLRGAPWSGRITCGHNPYLYARLVDDLRVFHDDGEGSVSWKERERPDLKFSPGAVGAKSGGEA